MDFLEAAIAPGFEKVVRVPDHLRPGSSTTVYRYDFLKMKQTNEKTSTVQDIRRIAVLRSA